MSKLLFAAATLTAVSASPLTNNFLKCDLASLPPCRNDDGTLKTNTLDADGCPSCVAFTDCSKLTIRTCTADEKPTVDFQTGCRTCNPPVCDLASYEKVPDCARDQMPELDQATGCPTCKINRCTEEEFKAVRDCASGEAPAVDADTNCPTCKPATLVCTKIASDLPLCDANTRPTISSDDGCPTCRYPVCDFSTLPKCEPNTEPTYDANKCRSCIPSIELVPCQTAPSDLRTCFPDERATIDASTRCLTCRPPVEKLCTTDPSKIPECGDAEKPTLDANRCPSCRPANGRPETPQCAPEAIKKCQMAIRDKVIRECEADERPRRDPDNCCVSCVRRQARCDLDAIKRCHALRTTDGALKECADREELTNAWDPTTCCSSCKRPQPLADEEPTGTLPAEQKCTKEAVMKCRAKTPVCENPEQRMALRALAGDRPRCCAVCQQAPPTCTLVDRVKCARATEVCQDGEPSLAVRGECCRSCKPRPTVAPTGGVCSTCKDDEACLRGPDRQPKCVKRRRIRKRVALATKEMRDQIRDLPDADKLEYIKEQIDSFCDQQLLRVQLACKRFKDGMRDGIKVTTRPGQTDDSDASQGRTDKEVDFEFQVPEGDETVIGDSSDYDKFSDVNRGRRLLVDDAVEQAFTEVICDSADGFGACKDWDDSTTIPTDPTKGVNGASVAQPVAALMAAVAFLL